MSLSWHQRKIRLTSLLQCHGDEEAEGLALDRLMHGQSIIGRTAKTTEIDSLRFKDKDLNTVGTLEYGQYGVIDVVTCRLDNGVYVRKSIQKKFALRARDQCFPQFERDLLLQGVKTESAWVPHLLCAYQTPTHLNLVMDYAEGGTLWDVLESSPHDGRILELDLRWWAPQLVSAIHWCHSQGYAHRDVKPHNFVLTPDAHVLLIDFGSAAPLLPPKADGTQLIAKRYCLVPCGTCDYISPEILQAHEEALVAMEMEDEEDIVRFGKPQESEGYGVETDWWSLGAMLYEMAYGVAPFFANDIRQTYNRIMNHERSLRFDQKVQISHELQHFLHRLLTHAKQRLGRRNVMEITDHPLFDGIDWTTLPTQAAPPSLHLPQFVYSDPKPATVASDPEALPAQPEQETTESYSQGYPFSAFFQPSSSASPGLSILRPSPGSASMPSVLASSSRAASSFIGFSWGPKLDAFPEEPEDAAMDQEAAAGVDQQSTPRPIIRTPLRQTPLSTNIDNTHQTLSVPRTWGPGTLTTPGLGLLHAYTTPVKPYALSHSPYATLPRTRTGTIRRTAPRRDVSDREAMKQLVDCVGMSARKKVLESGRKPKLLGARGPNGTGGTSGRKSGGDGTGTLKKELRFDKITTPIPGPDYSAASSARSASRSRSRSRSLSDFKPANFSNTRDESDIYAPQEVYSNFRQFDDASSTSSSDVGDAPPSPSPSPRPGSAMSMMSMTMMSRRSGSMTPTVSGYLSGGNGTGRLRSGSASGLLLVPGDRSVTTTMTATATSSTGPLLGTPTFSGARGTGKHEKDVIQLAQAPSSRRIDVVGSAAPSLLSSEKVKSRSGSASLREPPALSPSNSQRAGEAASPPSPQHLTTPPPAHSSTPPAAFTAMNKEKRHSMEVDQPPSARRRHNRSMTTNTLLPGHLLDRLEERHAAMMRDIDDLEERIIQVSSSLLVGN